MRSNHAVTLKSVDRPCLCPLFQTAFEVLSFVSVVSNCWLLLLSPRLQTTCQEAGMSSTSILMSAVLVEV